MSKLGQEPAFPIEEMQKNVNDTGISELIPHLGMSKRFYAACFAMQGILSTKSQYIMGNRDLPIPNEIAKYSLECADELLKQENL
jgi:hypothetical protein